MAADGVEAAPAATDEVRRHNTARVLRLLRDEGPSSRADLARRSGLAKATVGTIVTALQQAGAVAEGSVAPTGASGRGRPSTPVTLDGAGLVGLGVEVNVDYLALSAVDLAGRELLADEHAVTGPAPTLADVLAVVADAAGRVTASGATLVGVTVAVPGLVDREAGRVADAPNLGWHDLPLADEVARALAPLVGEVAVAVDNDANCAARAEGARGVAVGCDDFVYLTGTVGLGGGVVSGGRVLRGSRGLAGEVGHLRVGDGEEVCVCGRRGCWEALVGLRALADATGVPVRDGEDPVAYAERLARLADSPDVAAGLARVATALGRGCALLAVALDPGMVVLGGSFVPLGGHLVPAVEEALDRVFTGPGCRVALSTLGLHAASVGAAVDALDDVYSGRRPLPLIPLPPG